MPPLGPDPTISEAYVKLLKQAPVDLQKEFAKHEWDWKGLMKKARDRINKGE